MAQVNLAQFPLYNVEEYPALEQMSDIKHEYVDGLIVAMVGTSKAHDVIVHNLQRVLANHLQGTPCRVAGSDLKLYVESASRFFYPDLMGGLFRSHRWQPLHRNRCQTGYRSFVH